LKKFIALILLSVFLFNFAGFAVMFFVEQHLIYFEMKEKINEEKNLQAIVLSKEDAKKYLWDDGKELKIHDKMYDIARSEDKGDEIIFYCVHDEAEGNLFAKLDSFFDMKDLMKNTDGKMELQLVKFLTLVTIQSVQGETNKQEIQVSSIQEPTQRFSCNIITPDTQPPRQA
jgi:hypothetical protein